MVVLVRRQTALGQKFLHVTIREGIAQIPTDRAKDDRWFEVFANLNTAGRGLHTGTSLADLRVRFATHPVCLQLVFVVFQSHLYQLRTRPDSELVE